MRLMTRNVLEMTVLVDWVLNTNICLMRLKSPSRGEMSMRLMTRNVLEVTTG